MMSSSTSSSSVAAASSSASPLTASAFASSTASTPLAATASSVHSFAHGSPSSPFATASSSYTGFPTPYSTAFAGSSTSTHSSLYATPSDLPHFSSASSSASHTFSHTGFGGGGSSSAAFPHSSATASLSHPHSFSFPPSFSAAASSTAASAASAAAPVLHPSPAQNFGHKLLIQPDKPGFTHVYVDQSTGKRYRVRVIREYLDGSGRFEQLGNSPQEMDQLKALLNALPKPSDGELFAFNFSDGKASYESSNDPKQYKPLDDRLFTAFHDIIKRNSFSQIPIQQNELLLGFNPPTQQTVAQRQKSARPDARSQGSLNRTAHNSDAAPSFQAQLSPDMFDDANFDKAADDWHFNSNKAQYRSHEEQRIQSSNFVLGLEAVNRKISRGVNKNRPFELITDSIANREHEAIHMTSADGRTRLSELELSQPIARPIVIPIMVPGHFTGIIIDPPGSTTNPSKRGKIIYYDSLGNGLGAQDRFNEVKKFWEKNKDKLGAPPNADNPFEGSTYELIVKSTVGMGTPDQKDENPHVHCAAWVTRYIEQYFSNGSDLDHIPADIIKYRNGIAEYFEQIAQEAPEDDFDRSSLHSASSAVVPPPLTSSATSVPFTTPLASDHQLHPFGDVDDNDAFAEEV
ncbi:MAG: hypothetical protein JSS32_06840 [Verrucomicrobia bacterium]|nr:hypothetical protein [Verrucomicrobiota bacterium]